MHLLNTFLVISLFVLVPFQAHADYFAVQSDWSGGDGIPGPVWDWGNEFYQSSCIDWSGYPGSLVLLQDILEHTIDGAFNGAHSVYSEDIDGDGDMDVLSVAANANDITWWENSDTSPGIYWTEHTIDGDFNGAQFVYSEDIDGDGDMDVLGAAFADDDITWWENEDGSGTSWTEHIVDGDFDGAVSVYSEDIDGDGNMDVLGAAYDDEDITWWDITPTGCLESSIFEIAWPVDDSIEWGVISWLGTEPSNTELSFLVRASDNPGDMGPWSDTITVSGTSLAGLLGEYDGYLQYMAIMETGDPGTTSILDEITIDWAIVSIDDTAEPIPPGIALLPITPNPVKGTSVIRFVLPESASVEIFIFDLLGRLVSEIHGDEYSPGSHDVLLEDLSSGTYFCRMTSGDYTDTQRFVVLE